MAGKRTAPTAAPLSADELSRAQAEARALLPEETTPAEPTSSEGAEGGDFSESMPSASLSSGRALREIGKDVGACLRVVYVGAQLLRVGRSPDFEPDRDRARQLPADLGLRIAPFVAPRADAWLRWIGFGASFGADLLDGELRIALERRKAKVAAEKAAQTAPAPAPAPQVIP